MALYRVLAGKHHTGSHKDGSNRTYVRGDIVESDNNLTTFNSRGAMKFELVNESGQPIRASAPARNANPVIGSQAPAPQVRPITPAVASNTGSDKTSSATLAVQDLEQMSVADLKTLAAAEEIELGSASRKDEIIKVLRAANVSKAVETGYKS